MLMEYLIIAIGLVIALATAIAKLMHGAAALILAVQRSKSGR